MDLFQNHQTSNILSITDFLSKSISIQDGEVTMNPDLLPIQNNNNQSSTNPTDLVHINHNNNNYYNNYDNTNNLPIAFGASLNATSTILLNDNENSKSLEESFFDIKTELKISELNDINKFKNNLSREFDSQNEFNKSNELKAKCYSSVEKCVVEHKSIISEYV